MGGGDGRPPWTLLAVVAEGQGLVAAKAAMALANRWHMARWFGQRRDTLLRTALGGLAIAGCGWSQPAPILPVEVIDAGKIVREKFQDEGARLVAVAQSAKVRYVDLTAAPTPEVGASTVRRVSGGGLSHGSLPGTITARVELLRIVPAAKKDDPATLEVELTNTGTKDIVLPVSNDPANVVPPYAEDKRELLFSVSAGGPEDGISVVRSVSSSLDRTSALRLAAGDSLVYKLPLDRRRADYIRELRNSPILRITVSVTLRSIRIEDGIDSHSQVGDVLRSQNSLWWPVQ